MLIKTLSRKCVEISVRWNVIYTSWSKVSIFTHRCSTCRNICLASLGEIFIYRPDSVDTLCISFPSYLPAPRIVRVFITGTLSFRCVLEIINCALYLSRQGGDFGTETVIAILTTNNFTNVSHPLVKETLSSSRQEGKSLIDTLVNQSSCIMHRFVMVLSVGLNILKVSQNLVYTIYLNSILTKAHRLSLLLSPFPGTNQY